MKHGLFVFWILILTSSITLGTTKKSTNRTECLQAVLTYVSSPKDSVVLSDREKVLLSEVSQLLKEIRAALKGPRVSVELLIERTLARSLIWTNLSKTVDLRQKSHRDLIIQIFQASLSQSEISHWGPKFLEILRASIQSEAREITLRAMTSSLREFP